MTLNGAQCRLTILPGAAGLAVFLIWRTPFQMPFSQTYWTEPRMKRLTTTMKIRESPIGIRSFLHYTRHRMRYFYMYVGEIKKSGGYSECEICQSANDAKKSRSSVKFPWEPQLFCRSWEFFSMLPYMLLSEGLFSLMDIWSHNVETLEGFNLVY